MIKGNEQLRRYTTIYPKTVHTINSIDDYRSYGYQLLKQSNNKKLGKKIKKGVYKDRPLYSLSLCEREMGCPKTCLHWNSCYGNNMPFAHRFRTDDDITFTSILKNEIINLLKKHKQGIHIRLHVLGDFFSNYYIDFWRSILFNNEKVSIYGYTAHKPTSEFGKQIKHVIDKMSFERFAIRFSNSNVNLSANSTEYKPRVIGQLKGLICPEQDNKVDSCSNCALCWNDKAQQILFKTH